MMILIRDHDGGEILDFDVEKIGEHIPGKMSNVSLNDLKEFVGVANHIPWYESRESNKVFPIYLQEISDLSPIKSFVSRVIRHNPFFDHTQVAYFMAKNGRRPLGRIAAYIDFNYCRAHGRQIGWVGVFESVEEQDVAFALFDTAIEYLKGNGCEFVTGPAKYNANGEIGLLVDGFELDHYFMEPYNPPYYQDFFVSYGFKKENDWYSYQANRRLVDDYLVKMDSLYGRLNGSRYGDVLNGCTFRTVDLNKIDSEIDLISRIYNQEWGKGNHPQFVVMTDEEFRSFAKGIQTVAIKEMILIVENDGKPVGVSVSLPNVNEVIREYDMDNPRRRPSNKIFNLRDIKRDLTILSRIRKKLKYKDFKTSRVLILGVKEENRKRGIDSMLYYKTIKTLIGLGFENASFSEVADINQDMLLPLKRFGNPALTWRVYGLSI